MGVVFEGDLTQIRSNACQPRKIGLCKQVQGGGGRVVRVVGLFLPNNILRLYRYRGEWLRNAKGGFGSVGDLW
jgi:hypothetical protein